MQGNFPKAKKYYQLCLDKGVLDEKIFSNYGLIHQHNGNYKEAIRFFRRAIELNPKFEDAYSNLGGIRRPWPT